jgi:hypothetical protein
VTGRRVRRRRELVDDLKERRGYSYLKEEALDHIVWRARFGRVVRQPTKWVYELQAMFPKGYPTQETSTYEKACTPQK